jgi:hypothetical protein
LRPCLSPILFSDFFEMFRFEVWLRMRRLSLGARAQRLRLDMRQARNGAGALCLKPGDGSFGLGRLWLVAQGARLDLFQNKV